MATHWYFLCRINDICAYIDKNTRLLFAIYAGIKRIVHVGLLIKNLKISILKLGYLLNGQGEV